MENMKTVIVDDDESAVDSLCFELKQYNSVSVEGIARTGAAGIKLIEKVKPDLLFLDVELPDMLGMDVVMKLREWMSWSMRIVFYTAYSKYMIDALRSYAFDFLLKPVDRKELAVVLSRLETQGKEEMFPHRIGSFSVEGGEKPFMLVTPTGDLRVVRASDIGYFRYQSSRKLWEVALTNGTYIPLRRNTSAEQLCAYDELFVQIHQSYIINLNYLIMVQDNRCVMYPPFDSLSEDLIVSKKYRKEMMKRFFQL